MRQHCHDGRGGAIIHSLTVLLLDDVRDAWRTEPREHRLALLIVAAITVAIRLLYLAQPMRNDEALTYLDYVRLPWPGIVSTYASANNHVLHTLLAKFAVAAFGDAPWALRIPAFVAGILVVPASYAVARVLYNGRVALLTAALVATSGMLVLYAANARGYSLVVLAFLLLMLLAIRLVDGRGRAAWAAFIAIGALGVWTVPAMLYPLGSVLTWMLFNALVGKKDGIAHGTLLSAVAIAAIVLLLYSPAIAAHGAGAMVASTFSAPGWFDFFRTLPASVATAVMSWSAGVPLLSVALALLAVLSLRRPSRLPVGFGVAAFVWCSWLLLITHRTPLPRAWLWLYPVIAMRAAVEVMAVLEGRDRTRSIAERPAKAIAIFTLVLAICVVTTRAVPSSRETGTFHDAEDVAAELGPNLLPTDVVMAGVPSNGPLSYYFRRAGVRPPQMLPDSAGRVFVIVDVAEGQTLDLLTEGSVVRDTARFVLPRIVKTFTTSGIFLYSRRHATTR
jgi:hypothetical protein